MRFMLQVRADRDSETGILPGRELIEAMFKYNEDMSKAGVMLAAEGLHPSAKGARVVFAGAERTVIDGPFDADGLIAGFWIIDVGTKEDAIAWAKRIPFQGGVVEIRQVYEMEDFGPALTPEMRAAEDRLRTRLAARTNAG
ncbi:MAG TPA: YciI family protein [Stellaceae bacterium]|nr:YciI family protein [Stellaceae bacterium]